MSRPLAVVVGDARFDPLIAPLMDGLDLAKVGSCLIPPRALASHPVEIGAEAAFLDGKPIGAVVFRARPMTGFAEDFVEEDADFAAAETRAAWLHITAIPAVRAVNRGDCDAWFTSSEWPVWRHRLHAAGIPVSKLAVGDLSALPAGGRWLQWNGGTAALPDPLSARCLAAAGVRGGSPRRALWCDGDILDGEAAGAIDGASTVLEDYGVSLAGIDLDDDGHVMAVTTMPALSPPVACAVANRLVSSIDGHLSRW